MERCLVMFYGNMSSFVTALREIDEGNTVDLLVLNSGCILEEENAITMAKRIVKRYGKDTARVAGALSTLAERLAVERNWKSFSTRELCRRWASVSAAQAQCFFCQASMWIGAIAYAIAHDIHLIACHYKLTDMSCTGSLAFRNFVTELAAKYDIHVEMPLWTFEQTVIEADKLACEMMEHKFASRVLEPNCCVGLPTTCKIGEGEALQLVDYIKSNVSCEEIIQHKADVLATTNLTDKSLEPLMKWSKPTDGLF